MNKTIFSPPRGTFRPDEVVTLHILESSTCSCHKAERTFDWEITAVGESIYDCVEKNDDVDIYSFEIKSENTRRFRELYHDGLDIVNSALVLSKEKGEKIKEIASEALGLLVDPEQDIDGMCFLKLGR